VALQPCRPQAAVNAVPQPKSVRMRSRWLAYRLNPRFRIILIQQPEPSGSEAGEYHGWETGVGKFGRQSTSLMLCRVFWHDVNLRHGTDGTNQLVFVMVKSCVFFAVWVEFLNIIYASFGFKGLVLIRNVTNSAICHSAHSHHVIGMCWSYFDKLFLPPKK
jgi:hypothetical protein